MTVTGHDSVYDRVIGEDLLDLPLDSTLHRLMSPSSSCTLTAAEVGNGPFVFLKEIKM